MPPQGMPHPDPAASDGFVLYLENSIDRAAAAKPIPGRATLHQLNRTEYANAMKDLLALDIDPAPLLADKDGLNALRLAAGVSWADKIRGTEPEALAAVQLCVTNGLDLNTATEKGDTALYEAANRGTDQSSSTWPRAGPTWM